LEGTLSSIAIGVLNGAHIIRSHDVLQTKKAIAVADAIKNGVVNVAPPFTGGE
jgi:dihydropteroate synthase